MKMLVWFIRPHGASERLELTRVLRITRVVWGLSIYRSGDKGQP